MRYPTMSSMAVACWLFATFFFLPGLTPPLRAQDTGQPGVFGDDGGDDGGNVEGDDGNWFVAHPSKLLGKTLPKKVDLRSEMPPVGDQGDIGSMSCVTFATVYYQMSQYVKRFKHPEWDLKNPEHQFSVAFISKLGGQGYPGKIYPLLQEFGCIDNAEMQYNQWTSNEPTAAQFEAAKPYRINGYAALWDHTPAKPPYDPPNPIQNAKAWLADGHVLSVGIDPGSPGFPGASGGCAPPTRFYDISDLPHDYSPGHGVALCGYNDNINPRGKTPDHRGGFLMVNSEGPHWNGAMRGYIWLSYAYVKRYISDCWVMTMDHESDAPTISGCTVADGSDGKVAIISGTNFGSYRRLAGVTFNGVRAYNYKRWNNESVTVLLSTKCATTGPVIVYNWEDTPSNAFPFEGP